MAGEEDQGGLRGLHIYDLAVRGGWCRLCLSIENRIPELQPAEALNEDLNRVRRGHAR